MKVMVIVKATKDSEAGALPSAEMLQAMGAYNQQLIDAGIMLSGDGLRDSGQGARVRFSGPGRTVTRGPFPEVEQLVAGFWIWEVASLDEAIEWVKRCPNPMLGDSTIEIRPFFEMADFADHMSAELKAQEERQRAQLESQA